MDYTLTINLFDALTLVFGLCVTFMLFFIIRMFIKFDRSLANKYIDLSSNYFLVMDKIDNLQETFDDISMKLSKIEDLNKNLDKLNHKMMSFQTITSSLNSFTPLVDIAIKHLLAPAKKNVTNNSSENKTEPRITAPAATTVVPPLNLPRFFPRDISQSSWVPVPAELPEGNKSVHNSNCDDKNCNF